MLETRSAAVGHKESVVVGCRFTVKPTFEKLTFKLGHSPLTTEDQRKLGEAIARAHA